MKQKKLTAVAVLCGAVCAACIGTFLFSVQNEANAARAEVLAKYGGDQVEVCVAARDLYAGERVDASAVDTRLWVADLLPEEAVREASDIVGKTVASSVLKGEVISGKRFESSYSALDIPAGMQAVSVPAKAVQAVGGAIQPGMSVDVYSSGDTTTAAIARSVVVLATSVGESGSLISADSGWITLAVVPEKVQEIIAASSRTSLYFALPGDASQSDGAAAFPKGEGGESASDGAGGEASSDDPESVGERGVDDAAEGGVTQEDSDGDYSLEVE